MSNRNMAKREVSAQSHRITIHQLLNYSYICLGIGFLSILRLAYNRGGFSWFILILSGTALLGSWTVVQLRKEVVPQAESSDISKTNKVLFLGCVIALVAPISYFLSWIDVMR